MSTEVDFGSIHPKVSLSEVGIQPCASEEAQRKVKSVRAFR